MGSSQYNEWSARENRAHIFAASHQLMATLWPQAAATSLALVLAAVGVHTLSLFLVTSAVALLVYEKLGVAFLRHAWFNLDVLWAAGLFIAGVMALV